MSISRPSLNFQLVPDSPTPDVLARRTLLIAQKLPAGTAVAGDVIQNIQNNNQQDTLFGAGSEMAAMVRAFKYYNNLSPLDVIPIDAPVGATASTFDLVVAGAASENGSITVTIGSEKYNKYVVTILNADANTTVADNIANAVNADSGCPVTALAAAGTVTFTAKNLGPEGNQLSAKVTLTDANGITFSLTEPAGGTAVYNFTGLFDDVLNVRYTSIVAPIGLGTDFLKDFLQDRFNSDNIVLDGVAFQALHDTFANLSTYAGTLNSQSNVFIGYNDTSGSIGLVNEERIGSAILELDYVIATYYAALRELRLFEGAQIGDYVSASTGSLDKFGGPAIAGLPYFNTPISALPVISPQDEFTEAQLNVLRDANISVLGNNRTRTSVIMSDAVTTYISDAIGNPDLTFKYLNAVDISSVCREVFFNRAKDKYAQARLTTKLVSGYSNATAASIKAFFVGVYVELAGQGFNLVQGSEEAIAFYKDNLIVNIIDYANGVVNVQMKLPINSQVRVIDATLSINLSLIN